MFRSPHRRALAVAIVTLMAAIIGASSASAATVANGDFETGNLSGWTQVNSTSNVEWRVEAESFPQPFSGTHLAESVQEGPGTTYLYQDIALEPDASHQLQMAFAYESEGPITIPSPDFLDVKSEAEPADQQVRVDVIKPSAPISTLASGDILATVFASSESENTEGTNSEPLADPRLLTADLSAFAGQTVRLRVAVAVNRAELNAFVDNVSVTSTPLPPKPVVPTPVPAPAPVSPPTPAPSNVFTEGKLTLNKKTGAATLAVTVPGAGTLNAADTHSKIALGSFANAKSKKAKPVLVRSVTVGSAGAGTILVPVRPTAAAQKILEKSGKLAVSLKLTFIPAGGVAATQTYSGKLVKALKPAPR